MKMKPFQASLPYTHQNKTHTTGNWTNVLFKIFVRTAILCGDNSSAKLFIFHWIMPQNLQHFFRN